MLTNAFQNMAAGGMSGMSMACGGMAVSASTTCSGNPENPLGESMRMMMYGGGCPDPSQSHMMMLQLDQAICAALCPYGVAQAKQQELKCLSGQALALENTMQSLQKVFTQNIQMQQAQVRSFRALREDRDSQLTDVQSRLNGDPGGGTPGLLKQQEVTQEKIQELSQKGLELQQAQQKVTQTQQILNEQKQNRKMALTMDCFANQPVAGMKCSPNGDPVSPMQYALCREKQLNTLGSNGAIQQNSVVSAQANSSESQLSSVFSNVVKDAPSLENATISSDPDEIAGAATKMSVSVLSVPDVIARYGSQLSNIRMGPNGPDAGTVFCGRSQLLLCESRKKP
jgi:hypothetical protein